MQLLSISKQKQREWADDCYSMSVHIIFTQMIVKKGIKQFKERAVAAILKEFEQLHDMTMFIRVCTND